ncbi:MAG: helicase-related protein [Candidatus Komeilibacteria bacterium]|nr:helicase-related protein [Candidatus Komeilibacteria bacterium]
MTDKPPEIIHIGGNDNFFSRVYLTPRLLDGRVLWVIFNNDWQLKRGFELLRWWIREQKKSTDLQVWPTDQPPPAALLYQILRGKKIVIATTPTNLMTQRLPRLDSWQKRIITLSPGDKLDPYEFRKTLVELGYTVNRLADQPGLISPHGETMDIWPLQEQKVYRLIFSPEKLERISLIDTDNKKIGANVADLIVTPATEIIKQKESPRNYVAGQSLFLSAETLAENSELEKYAWHKIYLTQGLATEKPRLQSLPTFHQRWADLQKFLREKKSTGWKVNVITTNEPRLKTLTQRYPLPIDDQKLFPNFTFSGLADIEERVIFITDYEIFRSEPDKSVRRFFVPDVAIDDFVVHRDHGIAKLTATTSQQIDGITREYLVLQYAANDKLYLPVDQADKISKYLGVRNPILHRLGVNSSWPQTIRKLKQDMIRTAQELLNLYARREMLTGIALPPHPTAETKLAHDFPYQETPDQQAAVDDALADLEEPKPTERLVCGDVGFGKTEVAMRAAWRTVLNNHQVIILCPTTLLAQQHYDTFCKRFAGYPVNIELLSRFVENSQQKKILSDIAAEKTNIIIGTHRLLSKDLQYGSVGLIIIDEEQQFGVRDKEKLKEWKAAAHILSLSATPIPRTLNLALSGLRNISVIATPPVGRQPIETYIKPFAEELVKKALADEIVRGGQVYYLYNKVETIEEQLRYLQKLAPTYRYEIMHGQLPPDRIAAVMHRFDTGQIDVLICSTIIANGLDLPNVNTLIVDGAQNYGLAQLYQIRGRVGRSDKKAHAYFLYHSHKLKGLAAKRLEALQSAHELGSGFQIAMRDMEIRGIGNILGKQQHGKVSLVGLSLYGELLNQTITEIQSGRLPQALLDTTVDLPINYSLPAELFETPVGRLKFYQLASASRSLEELQQHFSRLDKPWPKEVDNLYQVMAIKILCQQAGIITLDSQKDRAGEIKFILTFKDELNHKIISRLLDQQPAWEFKENELRIFQSQLGKNWVSKIKEAVKMFTASSDQ